MDAPDRFLRRPFAAAVAAADPGVSLARRLPEPPRGRDVEFRLALGHALRGHSGIPALAPDTAARAAALGLSVTDSLDRSDGHGVFEALGDAAVAGPALTNVNDVRATPFT